MEPHCLVVPGNRPETEKECVKERPPWSMLHCVEKMKKKSDWGESIGMWKNGYVQNLKQI